MPYHDKRFLTCFLPLAIATFLSGPCAVLHSFGLLEPGLAHLVSAPSHVVHSVSSVLWIDVEASRDVVRQDFQLLLPVEVPLLFQMDTYPDTGFKRIHVDDERFMKLTQQPQASSNSSDTPTPFYVGYIPIAETQKLRNQTPKGYPEGDLVLVHSASLNTTFVELETEKLHRFRLKTVRKDLSTGLLYGRVEWIHNN